MHTIGFVPEWQAGPDVQQNVQTILAIPASVRDSLNGYIKAANK
jgi:hypothetical protein